MRAGKSYWILNFSMHIDTGLLRNVLMESFEEYIPEYSPIRRTIQRSAFLLHSLKMFDSSHISRALIATIKDMGLCPCPRCLMPKGLFSYLGLRKDMKSRLQNLRVYVTTKVVKAREFIYAFGNTVDGAKVEDALGEGSWVPILVSASC